MALTNVLITVKTYPTLSKKYEELVCTAGFREDGTWIRIFPLQFRKRSYSEQYAKYEWIELDLVRNTKDFRPESYRPRTHDTEIRIGKKIEADGGCWKERRKYVLNKVYTNLEQLIAEAKDKSICTSLAVFKPHKVIAFIIEEVEREWDKDTLNLMRQGNLFDQQLNVIKKLPYKFSYRFIDDANKESTLMIEDWEIGQLFWNCLRNHPGDEKKASDDVKNKYFEDFAKKKDLHLFLGTTQKYHIQNAPNPFVIIGTFHPKFENQFELGLL